MPGISAVKTGLPFSKKGFSFAQYWNTRNPSALALTVISDVSIQLDWTANGVEDYDGYSVERSADGVTYAEVDTVAVGTETFTDTGLTPYTLYYYRVRAYKGTNYSSYSNVDSDTTLVPSILSHQTEGLNDFIWYDTEDVANITKDADTGEITTHKDKLNPTVSPLFASGGAGTLPIWISGEGVTFDGVNDYMMTGSIVGGLVQPTSIFLIIKPITWTKTDTFIDGNGLNTGIFRQVTTTPKVYVYAGTGSSESSDLTLGEWHIVRIVFNGVNSRLQIDDHAAITGNFGAANMGGITVGKSAALFNYYGNFAYKQMLFGRVLLSAVDEAIIYDYLKKKNSLTVNGFLQKYYTKTMNDNNQLNVVMAGDSIFGRMNAAEISLSPGEATGFFPPNMWQQNVAYKVLERLQYGDADVHYYNLAAWTRSANWALRSPVLTDGQRIWTTSTLNDYAEIVITGASYFKMLYYTEAAAANEITITFNGSAPSALGLTGDDTFDTLETNAASNLYKWYPVVWSGLDPATTYTVRITNTGGGTSGIWGGEAWSAKRINVIVAAHGGYTAALQLSHVHNFTNALYDADLIIHELPCLNDSYTPRARGGKMHDAAAIANPAENDFIYALDSGTFTNYSGLELTAGDYAEFDGTNWVAGSSRITAMLSGFVTNLSYIDTIVASAIPCIYIIPHKMTSEDTRPWLTVMKESLRTKLKAVGASYIDMDAISAGWNLATALADGTHLNDISVGYYFDEIDKLV